MRRGTPCMTHPCSAAPGGGAGVQDDVHATLTVLWEMAANAGAQQALFLQFARLRRWAGAPAWESWCLVGCPCCHPLSCQGRWKRA